MTNASPTTQRSGIDVSDEHVVYLTASELRALENDSVLSAVDIWGHR